MIVVFVYMQPTQRSIFYLVVLEASFTDCILQRECPQAIQFSSYFEVVFPVAYHTCVEVIITRTGGTYLSECLASQSYIQAPSNTLTSEPITRDIGLRFVFK